MERFQGHGGASSVQLKKSLKQAKDLLVDKGLLKKKQTDKGGGVLAVDEAVGTELDELKEDEVSRRWATDFLALERRLTLGYT